MRVIREHSIWEFEWNENKARSNFEKHGITFEEAAEPLAHPHLEQESNRNGEVRVLAICPLSMRIIAVIYTLRGEKRRVISARAARDDEQREYRHIYAG